MSTRLEIQKQKKEREELRKLFLVKRNQVQMVKDRGYDVEATGEIDMLNLNYDYTFDQLLSIFKTFY